jgi:hypothetical protein
LPVTTIRFANGVPRCGTTKKKQEILVRKAPRRLHRMTRKTDSSASLTNGQRGLSFADEMLPLLLRSCGRAVSSRQPPQSPNILWLCPMCWGVVSGPPLCSMLFASMWYTFYRVFH